MGGYPETSGPGTPVSVLLVDDEAALLEATARLLRHAGMIVTPCLNGESAIVRVRTERFDVVVSDLAMPGLGGIELLRLLRAEHIDVPVVLVTGSPSLDTAMKAVEYGAFKYLTKPVDRAELVSTVEQAARARDVRSGPRQRNAQEPPADRALVEPGAVLGERYRLRRALGAGGMGEVWEATHLITNRAVALKLLHPSLNARPEMRRRLLREARAATAFAHPNVPEVFDVFELADGSPVIVMELLRGQTLRARLDESPITSVIEACGVMIQVVSAVGAGHAHGVIHRDVKPENVMWGTSGGLVKVMDFGVAKLVHADPRDGTSVTAAGVAVGTLGYMAPEQACGEQDIDHRADIWSVGAVLYEALTGQRPVPGTTLGQIIAHQLTERPVPLAQRAPGAPSSLAALVDRMLERDPSARPADLREVHAEVARHTQVVAPDFGPPAAARARDPEADREIATSLGSAPTELGLSPARRRER